MASEQNIVSLFLESVEKHKNKAALVDDGVSVSYEHLLNDIRSLAAVYRKKGVEKGHRVLVMLPMSINLYKTVLALFYIGATPVFLDEWVSVKRLRESCRFIKCDAMVSSVKLQLFSVFVKELRNIKIKIRNREYTSIENIFEPVGVHSTDTALVTFTSGTSGVPKAAKRTHGYLKAQYNALKPIVDNRSKFSLVTLPIVVLVNLALGKTTILPPPKVHKEESLSLLVNRVRSQEIEELITSPAILEDVVDVLNDDDVEINIKSVLSGGGPVFPDLARKVIAKFKHAECIAVYGSTEAEPISMLNMNELQEFSHNHVFENGLPVGNIDIHTQVRIIPISDQPISVNTLDDLDSLSLKSGKKGEVIVSGQHVLTEYLDNIEANRRYKIKVGDTIWHRTGDVGSMDVNNQLYLWGRCADVFEHDSKTWYPLSVAYAFKQKTGCISAILSIDKQPVIFIESKQLPQAEIDAALQELGLTSFQVKLIEKLPRDKRHRTKVDYEKLRAML